MNTFKKGDRVKIRGHVFTVLYTNGPYVYHDGGFNHNAHYDNCTLVPKFKPGDRVVNVNGTEKVIKCVKTHYNLSGSKYDGDTAYDYVEGGWDRESGLTLVAPDAIEDLIRAGKKIEAIKEYRVKHGVGLLEGKNAVEAIAAKLEKPATLGDILDTALKPKFKVGDRVTHNEEDDSGIGIIIGPGSFSGFWKVDWQNGGYGICTDPESVLTLAAAPTGGFFKPGDVVNSNTHFGSFTVKYRSGSYTYFEGGGFELTSNLSLVKAAEPISIVALIKNGQPRSNERPHVHATNDSATKEARRLADANPGVDFGVFTLTSVSTAPPPVVTPATTRVVV